MFHKINTQLCWRLQQDKQSQSINQSIILFATNDNHKIQKD